MKSFNKCIKFFLNFSNFFCRYKKITNELKTNLFLEGNGLGYLNYLGKGEKSSSHDTSSDIQMKFKQIIAIALLIIFWKGEECRGQILLRI